MGRWLTVLAMPMAVGVLSVALVTADCGGARAATCARGDFVSVVDEAASALRDLNQSNKATFQERLRALKAKNNWNQEEYLNAARPFVRDEKIASYDAQSTKLLGEIAALGQEGSEAAKPDCEVLVQLRARMEVLVKAQEDKWSYMFAKIDDALKP